MRLWERPDLSGPLKEYLVFDITQPNIEKHLFLAKFYLLINNACYNYHKLLIHEYMSWGRGQECQITGHFTIWTNNAMTYIYKKISCRDPQYDIIYAFFWVGGCALHYFFIWQANHFFKSSLSSETVMLNIRFFLHIRRLALAKKIKLKYILLIKIAFIPVKYSKNSYI